MAGRILYLMMSRTMARCVCGALLLMAAGRTAAAQPPAQTSDTLHLSLEEAVSTGLRVADEIRLSMAQADIADAQVDFARASMLPQLRINSSYTRTFESARSNAVSAVFNQPNTYSVNANVSQTLFQGGRLLATARAASALADAAELSAEERRALYTVEIQRAYLGALLAERLAELQRTNLQLAAARLSQVQQFHNAGRAAQYDVLRAKVERANIEPLTIQAQNDRELARLELGLGALQGEQARAMHEALAREPVVHVPGGVRRHVGGGREDERDVRVGREEGERQHAAQEHRLVEDGNAGVDQPAETSARRLVQLGGMV